MDNRKHGREAWTQFDEPTVDTLRLESTPLKDSLSEDPTPSHATHTRRMCTDAHAQLVPSVGPIMTYSRKSTVLSTVASPPCAPHAQIRSESMIAHADIWSITPEQRAYYLSQFLRLQSDPRAKLSGSQAKMFFELSKLPTAELSNIWELSDTDRDGQLTLGEFAVAMHLVVLRRNGIPVPSTLPDRLLEAVHTPSLSAIIIPSTNQENNKDNSGYSLTVTSILGQPARRNDRLHIGRIDEPVLLTHNRPWPGSPACLSTAMTPGSARQRRWSISSQSDISSLAEGIIHFESRPNMDSQLQHPIPIRARTLPIHYSALDACTHHKTDCQPLNTAARLFSVGMEAVNVLDPCFSDFSQPGLRQLPGSVGPSPPPPPPRARTISKRCGTHIDSLYSVMNVPQNRNIPTNKGINAQEGRRKYLEDISFVVDSRSVTSKLQQDCDDVMQANDQLASELMQLQQTRIALKILLERLMPLESVVCSS